MSYYQRPKYYSNNPQQIERTFQMTFIENKIYKNHFYRQSKYAVISIELAGMNNSWPFLFLINSIRTNKDGVKFRSYTPTFDTSQFNYFLDGFFNATDEEKVMFGLTFNNLDAYDMCLDAFNEAEAFYSSFEK